jgi:hypothetical protein
MGATQQELEEIGVELGMLEHTLSTLVSAAKLDGTIDAEEQDTIDDLEQCIRASKRKRDELQAELAGATGINSTSRSGGSASTPRDYTLARILPGNGGYTYAQWPDGELAIIQGPKGQKDLPVKRGTTAWNAITAEIGTFSGAASSSDAAPSDRYDEIPMEWESGTSTVPELIPTGGPSAKTFSKSKLDEMVRHPEIAHKYWEKLSDEQRAKVLAGMRSVYNEDWVDEFLTLQENGFRGEGVTHSHLSDDTSPPAPPAEELERQGYVRVRRYEYLNGHFIEDWVRPSGTSINVTRAPKKDPPPPSDEDEESPPPESADEDEDEEDEIEASGDISRKDLEEMVGFEIPGFMKAEIIDEDEEGNRTIKVWHVVQDEEGFEESRWPIFTCFADDTCNAFPQMFE